MRSSSPEMFCKKGVLRNFIKFTGKHLCCELCEISKNTLFHRTPLVAASLYYNFSNNPKSNNLEQIFFDILRFYF